MTDSKQRLFAVLFYLWALGLGLFLTFAGIVLARNLAPELWRRFFIPWAMLLLHGGVGIAIGSFELVIGLSPDFYIFQGSGNDDRFYCDRPRSRIVGSWRVMSCSFVNIMVFLSSRVFPF